MTSPDMDDEAMKAMARRIVNANSNYMSGLDRGQINFTAQEVLRIALAAIIETQELIENFVGAHSRHADPADIAAAIRSGQQFRKDV